MIRYSLVTRFWDLFNAFYRYDLDISELQNYIKNCLRMT